MHNMPEWKRGFYLFISDVLYAHSTAEHDENIQKFHTVFHNSGTKS